MAVKQKCDLAETADATDLPGMLEHIAALHKELAEASTLAD